MSAASDIAIQPCYFKPYHAKWSRRVMQITSALSLNVWHARPWASRSFEFSYWTPRLEFTFHDIPSGGDFLAWLFDICLLQCFQFWIRLQHENKNIHRKAKLCYLKAETPLVTGVGRCSAISLLHLGTINSKADFYYRYDSLRTLRLATYGGAIGGPLGHFWFSFLDAKVFPAAPKRYKFS